MHSTPTARRRRTVDTQAFIAMVARLIAAGGRRVSDGNLDDLQELIALRDQVDVAIVEAVRGFREAGATWEDIGSATGTTRQAAIQKWVRKV